LVPWQPILEKRIGQYITGLQRDDGGIEWTLEGDEAEPLNEHEIGSVRRLAVKGVTWPTDKEMRVCLSVGGVDHLAVTEPIPDRAAF
jgi:hypothetical protein